MRVRRPGDEAVAGERGKLERLRREGARFRLEPAELRRELGGVGFELFELGAVAIEASEGGRDLIARSRERLHAQLALLVAVSRLDLFLGACMLVAPLRELALRVGDLDS